MTDTYTADYAEEAEKTAILNAIDTGEFDVELDLELEPYDISDRVFTDAEYADMADLDLGL
jgi:hypothetical protein